MTLFFQELTKKLAEKWLALLVLPGLLLVASAATGLLLGHTRWADHQRLAHDSAGIAQDVTTRGTATVILAVGAVLLASAAAGLVATVLGFVVRWCWLGDWPRWAGALSRPLLAMRLRHWRQVDASYTGELLAQHEGENEPDRAKLDGLAQRRNRIAVVEPARPTWIGDRIAAVDARVYAEYRLDLASAWPRLWLLLPDTARGEVQTAAVAFDSAARLAAWAWLYLLVGVIWWPAVVIGAVTLTAAWIRGRQTITVYAELVESVVDLHFGQLAEALHLADKPAEDIGVEITSRLRKGA